MSKKKKKARKAAKKRARALKSIGKVVGLTAAALSVGAFHDKLKKGALAVFHSALSRVESLRAAYAGEAGDHRSEARARRDAQVSNGVMPS